MADDLGELIGSGARAEIFARGELALKLYPKGEGKAEAFREGAILAAIEPLGLPVPVVEDVRQHEGRWGVLMTRAQGAAFDGPMRADPASLDRWLDEMVRLHRAVHAHAAPPALPNQKTKLAAAIRRAPSLEDGRRQTLLAQLASLPEGDRLCHGDFHPQNLIGRIGRAMIVDWLDATSGHPAADLCRSFVLIHPVVPDLAEAYLERYCAAAGLTREAVMAWLPVIAAARLAEDVADEAPALMAMMEGG